jgi:hypothetical protein
MVLLYYLFAKSGLIPRRKFCALTRDSNKSQICAQTCLHRLQRFGINPAGTINFLTRSSLPTHRVLLRRGSSRFLSKLNEVEASACKIPRQAARQLADPWGEEVHLNCIPNEIPMPFTEGFLSFP